MHVYTHKKPIKKKIFFGGRVGGSYLQQTASEPFVELCFEGGK